MNVTAELLFLMLLVSFSTILYIFIIQRNVSSLVKWIFNSIKPHLLKLIAKYLPERVQMYLRGKGGKLFKRFKESSLFMPVLFTSSFYCYYVMTIRILILLDFFMVFGVSRYAFIIFFFVVSWTSIAVSTWSSWYPPLWQWWTGSVISYEERNEAIYTNGNDVPFAVHDGSVLFLNARDKAKMLCVAQRNRPEMINDIPSDRYEIVGYNGRFEFMSVNARTIDYARAVAEARGMGEAPIALSGQNPRAVAVSAHRQYLREKATDPLKVERQDRINASESAQARSELAEAQRRESIWRDYQSAMELYRDRQAVVEEMRKEAEKDPTRFTADDYAVMNFDFPEPELNYDLPQMSFQKTAEERLKESGIDVDKMLNLYGSDSTDFVPQILRLSKSSPSLLYYGRHNKVANSSEGKSRSFEDDEQGKVVSLKDSKEASNDEHLLNSPDKIELSSSAPSVMYYGEHNRVFQVSYDLPIELRRTTGEMTIEEMIEEYEKTERFRVINELAPTRRGNHKILDAGFDDLASSRQREHRILNAGFDDLSPSRHRKHRILDAGELSDESGNDLDAFGNEILLDEKYIEIDADAEFGPAETPGLMNYLPEGAITNRNLIRYNTLYDGTNVNYRPEFVYAEPAGFESELPIGVVSLAHYEVFLYAEELYLNFRDGGLPPIANSQLHWDGYFDSFYYSKPYSYLLIYLQNGVYVDHARVLFVHQLLHDYCADGFVDFYGINRSEEHVTFERFLSGSASRFEDYLIEGEVLHYQSFRAEHGKWSPSFQYYKDRVEAYLNGASQEVEFLEEETEPDPDGSKIFTEATFTPPIDITDQMPMDAEGALISQSHRHFMVIKKAEQYQKFFKFDRPEGMKMSSSQLTWDEEFEKVTSVTKTAEEILIYLQNGYFPYEDRAEFAHRVLLDYCSSNIVLERHEYDIDYSVWTHEFVSALGRILDNWNHPVGAKELERYEELWTLWEACLISDTEEVLYSYKSLDEVSRKLADRARIEELEDVNRSESSSDSEGLTELKRQSVMQMLGAVDSVGEDEIPSADFDRFRPLRIVRRGVAESESLLSNDDHFIDEDVDSRNDELSDTENLPAIEGPDLGDLF